jgi:hypothetical protein
VRARRVAHYHDQLRPGNVVPDAFGGVPGQHEEAPADRAWPVERRRGGVVGSPSISLSAAFRSLQLLGRGVDPVRVLAASSSASASRRPLGSTVHTSMLARKPASRESASSGAAVDPAMESSVADRSMGLSAGWPAPVSLTGSGALGWAIEGAWVAAERSSSGAAGFVDPLATGFFSGGAGIVRALAAGVAYSGGAKSSAAFTSSIISSIMMGF